MTRPGEGLVVDRRASLGTLTGGLLATPLPVEGQNRPRIALLFGNTPTAEISGPIPTRGGRPSAGRGGRGRGLLETDRMEDWA
jgi:hypothetical protein